MRQLPLIVIVGPTASGKTSLAIELAKKHGGEIISADSRTVYKYMDIGTAKPTLAEQGGVPHWGLDMLEPGEAFSVADFKKYADRKICEIRERGSIPFLVGGTGLYADAVVFNYTFGAKANPELRERLEKLSVKQLQEYCIEHNINLPENVHNKRHIVRAIERKGRLHTRKHAPINNTVIVGIATEKSVLLSQIRSRAEHIFKDNVVEEATKLGRKYGWASEAMSGNVYSLIKRYTDGEVTLDETRVTFTTLDWQLAKRQLTWFRRNPYIKWMVRQEAVKYLDTFLAPE